MKFILIIILLFMVGCGPSIRFGGKPKPRPIPFKPTEPPELKHGIQQSVDLIDQVADKAITSGISKNSDESKILKEQAQVLKMSVGSPTTPLILTVDSSSEHAENVRDYERMYRKDVSKWEESINSLANSTAMNYKLTKENGWLMRWIWGLGIGLLILCFVCPTVGIPTVIWLWKRAKKFAEVGIKEGAGLIKDHTHQLIKGIQEYKDRIKSENPDEYAKLKTSLEKHMDHNAKKLVHELKHERNEK